MPFTKVTFYSPAMQRNQDVAIFYPDPVGHMRPPQHAGGPARKLPPYPDGTFKYPVLYLIHGGGGSYMNWTLQTTIEGLAKSENTVIVMPTVHDRQATMEYTGTTEFIGKELPAYISYLFPVSTDPEEVSIGGFSFGGYFAWRTGILYPDTFGTVATFSSPVDIIGDLKIRPQENYVLEELEHSDHNLLWLIEQKKSKGEKLPRFFESFGDETDMCFPVNKTAIYELDRILGVDGWYWIQGRGAHNLDTCNRLIRKYFEWKKSLKEEDR